MTVINFNNQLTRCNLKFIRDIINIEKVNKSTGEITYDFRVVIKLKNLDNNRAVIHRYTDFINLWRNCKPKTVLDVADYLVPFLNYITFELSKKELPSVSDLTFDYGIEYLNEYAQNKSRNTVRNCERVLSKFFYFLASKQLLKNISKKDFTFTENSKGVVKMESPFKGKYLLPNRETKYRLHDIDEELVFTFLYTALEVVPQIALGVYFQMFGGLRYSEVVNLGYSSINLKGPYGQDGMVLTIKKNTFRPDLKSNPTTSAKKERFQPVIAISNLLSTIYKYHIKNFKSYHTDAVFIDTKGNAMSKEAYRNNFEKLKTAFIEKLKANDNPSFKLYSTYLQSNDWSTHICRGIFSNLISEVASNATEIAVWRGDSNLNSALSYVSDSKKVERKLIENMNNFYTEKIQSNLNNLLLK